MPVITVLWVSGLLTLLAVLMPQSVLYGLLLLIVPGLILWCAPTVFFYTATFAIVRRVTPVTYPRAHNLIAAAITLGLGVLTTLPMALPGWLAYRLATPADVVPQDRVAIRGDVLVSTDLTPTEGKDLNWRVPCHALCAVLLETPGVTSVTLTGTDKRGDAVKPISYRLVPKGDAGPNGVAPTKPEQILLHLPDPVKLDRRGPEYVIAARKARENAIISRWALRLAGDVALSIVPSPRQHDLTIKITNAIGHDAHGVSVKQVDVRDRDGRVLLRQAYATTDVVLVPLALQPYDLLGHPTWGLARTTLHTGDEFTRIDSINVLFDRTTLARPPEPGDDAAGERLDGVGGLRDRLAAAVTQPGAPADLSLAAPWLATLDWRTVTDDDVALAGKLIADARVTDLRPLLKKIGKRVRPELRGAIVARLLDPATPPKLRHDLDHLVRWMPRGTFAVPTPDELALLRNRSLRVKAPYLVEHSLADQGQAGVAELVRILQEDVNEPWYRRQYIVAALCRTLIRLGPDAAGALPAVIELFDVPHTALANDWTLVNRWRVAMVRMGRPIEQVPFPPQFTTGEIAQERSFIVQVAERVRDHPDEDLER
jgi:hypothetical protein